MIRVHAKVNLALMVSPPSDDGRHPLRGLFQTISLSDEVSVDRADEDTIVVRGVEAPADTSNLAWRAVAEARAVSALAFAVRVEVVKAIPTMAGLGGGSADAAGALVAASRLFSVPFDDVRTIAPRLGSDVPFALVGGTAVVAGRGELVAPLPAAAGFALAVVVPPAELATADVYRRWDDLDGPTGPELPARLLPPSLREHAPLRNDLYPAAVSLAPLLDEWRTELADRWGVAVGMTGSGAGLFGLFPTLDEAVAAVAEVPPGARFAEAAEPVDRGWEEIPGEDEDGRVSP